MATNVSPVAPITPVTDVSNFSPAVSQNAATAFATNVAVQDTNTLVNEGSATATSTFKTSTASQGDNTTLNESLTSLSPQAFITLNTAENNAVVGGANTNLTPAQLQEMQILQNDIAQISAAEEGTSSVIVSDNGTDLNLSVAAVTALNDIASVNNISSTNTLTVAQIQQAASVITPFVNQPLTPQLVTQMQIALVSAGFNPEQLSLQNLILSMNYAIAETMDAYSPDTIAMNEMIAEVEAIGEE